MNIKKPTKAESTDPSMTLGLFLKQSRENRGLTQKQVADYLKLSSAQSISDWENEKGSGIPAPVLKKLVSLYQVPEEEAYEVLLAFHLKKAEERVQSRFFGKKVSKP